jgi:uncharacterized protein YegL
MERKEVEIVFVLDMSGSMSGLENDTIGGYNSFLSKQRELDEPCYVTTLLFDNHFVYLHDRINIKDVNLLTKNDYQPSGSTALFDALGYSINKTINVCKSTSGVKRRVIFVIITDGYENASIRFTERDVKHLISSQRNERNFEFVFLGANIDSKSFGEDLGFNKDYCQDYKNTPKGVRKNFDIMARVVKKAVMENKTMDYNDLADLANDD